MKKIVLTVATIFAFGAMNAQTSNDGSYKPTKGTVATEVGLVGGLNNADFNLNTGVVKFRYFLKDNLGLRIGLGLNNDKFEKTTGTTPDQETQLDKTSQLDLKLGVEKHFAGSDRLSTYAGADLVIGSKKTIDELTFENGDFDKTETPESSFGINLFTGADYYIAKKLFLGVEAGLSFLSGKVKDTTNSVRNGSVTVDTTTPGNTTSSLTTQVYGGIRIGYQF